MDRVENGENEGENKLVSTFRFVSRPVGGTNTLPHGNDAAPVDVDVDPAVLGAVSTAVKSLSAAHSTGDAHPLS